MKRTQALFLALAMCFVMFAGVAQASYVLPGNFAGVTDNSDVVLGYYPGYSHNLSPDWSKRQIEVNYFYAIDGIP